jgi:hypothetical protein
LISSSFNTLAVIMLQVAPLSSWNLVIRVFLFFPNKEYELYLMNLMTKTMITLKYTQWRLQV